MGGCPKIVRGDAGTENAYVRDIHRFLRMDNDDPMAGDISYMEGTSTANQRIEYWWSFLQRECTDYWICFFRYMLDEGYFSGDFLDVNLVRFCFMQLVQVSMQVILYLQLPIMALFQSPLWLQLRLYIQKKVSTLKT